MMSRPQKYIEGEALHFQREKSNNALKLRVAVLVVCVLLVSALVVIYLLFELLKTREMLRNLELKQVTVKTDVTERVPEIKPCSTVQPTCPEPKVKIITEPCNTLPTTTLQPPEINMLTQSYSTISPTTPQPPDITTVTQSYSTIPPTSPQPLDITTVTQSYSTILPTIPQPLDITTDDPCYKCEDGWKQHGGKCYFFSTTKSSWNESSTGCITKGGGLVKIDSKEEQSFLRIAIQQKIEGYDDLFWIGLTHSAVEGRWLWVDGSPLNESLTFWYSREPDDLTGEDPDGENCAKMGKTYWFDRSCKVTDRSICEKPAVALCV